MKHKDDVLEHLNAPRFIGACMYISQWLKPRYTDYATYSNTYNGVLTQSQISRVIESIILRLPMPKIWLCSTTDTIFMNGYILESVKEFKKSAS